MQRLCRLSGEQFVVSERELSLRERFGVPPPSIRADLRCRHLGAFWQHFTLHRRPCGRSGEPLIAVFGPHCPYPVWKRSVWFEQADPPSAVYQPERPFFEQVWDVFRRSPIPHNVGLSNENCEYTDDWWESKDCYLCHSGVGCRDLRYCYRTLDCSDSQRLVFAFYSQLCSQLVNCYSCFQVHYAVNSRNCRDAAFLFDCRGCSDCVMCWNLRNKQYCVRNQQLTAQEYQAFRRGLQLHSRRVFNALGEEFRKLLFTHAWWRAVEIDRSEGADGAYLDQVKNVDNCFFVEVAEDCCNCVRGYRIKDTLESVGSGVRCERLYNCVAVKESYEVRNAFSVSESSFMDYCAFCTHCRHCLGCCGLVGKEYCIFNRCCTREEYEALHGEMVSRLKREGLWGEFFPAYFSPCAYEETFSGYTFPLCQEEQKKLGFRIHPLGENASVDCLCGEAVPDSALSADEGLTTKVFWDACAQRRFQIAAADIRFARESGVPLSATFYATEIKDLYRWMFFEGRLRRTRCARRGIEVLTHLPASLDGRILSDEAYQELL